VACESKPQSLLAVFTKLLDALALVYKTRGKAGLIVFSKAIRTNLINFLSGNPIRDHSVRMTSDGLPLVLGDLIPQIRSGSITQLTLRLLMTILFGTRALKERPNPSIDSIVGPLKKGTSTFELSKYVGEF
jgi:hypothetical protein